MKKQTFIFAFIVLMTSTFAQSYYAMPRTIKTEGRETLSLMPDIISIEFNVYNETSKTKLKLPLEKSEQQIRSFLKSKGVDDKKFIANNDPALCTYGYMTCTISNISPIEFDKINTYFKKNPYIENYFINKTLLKKETIAKNADFLAKKSADNANKKAHEIAKALGEKITGIQSITLQNTFIDASQDVEETPYNTDEIKPISIYSDIIVEYAIETKDSALNRVPFLPRLIHLNTTSYESIKKEKALVTFRLGITDFDENADEVFKKLKNQMSTTIQKYGVNPQTAIVKNTDDQEVYFADYSFELNGADKLDKLYVDLSFNKNVSDITYSDLQNSIDSAVLNKLNEQLTIKNVKEARALAEKLGRLFDVKVLRNYDFVDGTMSETYSYKSTHDGNLKGLESAPIHKNYQKISYMSFQIQ
jgi:uncharacterized protein YggE